MSKITNDGLTRSDTGCFIAVPIWQHWASKGQQDVGYVRKGQCYPDIRAVSSGQVVDVDDNQLWGQRSSVHTGDGRQFLRDQRQLTNKRCNSQHIHQWTNSHLMCNSLLTSIDTLLNIKEMAPKLMQNFSELRNNKHKSLKNNFSDRD